MHDSRVQLVGQGPAAVPRPGLDRRDQDIDQPYLIALQGEWRCSVIAFPRSAVAASRHYLDQRRGPLGVHDMPHFSRAFRARYGMTPSQARQTLPPAEPAAASG